MEVEQCSTLFYCLPTRRMWCLELKLLLRWLLLFVRCLSFALSSCNRATATVWKPSAAHPNPTIPKRTTAKTHLPVVMQNLNSGHTSAREFWQFAVLCSSFFPYCKRKRVEQLSNSIALFFVPKEVLQRLFQRKGLCGQRNANLPLVFGILQKRRATADVFWKNQTNCNSNKTQIVLGCFQNISVLFYLHSTPKQHAKFTLSVVEVCKKYHRSKLFGFSATTLAKMPLRRKHFHTVVFDFGRRVLFSAKWKTEILLFRRTAVYNKENSAKQQVRHCFER